MRDPNYTDEQRIKHFKFGLKRLLKEHKPGSGMWETRGLCQGIDQNLPTYQINGEGKDASYDIMQCMLTSYEFEKGLGESYLMTEDRWYFGQFLLEMPTEDFIDFMENEYES